MRSTEGFRVKTGLLCAWLLLASGVSAQALASVVIDHTELLPSGVGPVSIAVEVTLQRLPLVVEATASRAIQPTAVGLGAGGEVPAAGTDASVSTSAIWSFGWEQMRKQPGVTTGPVSRDVPVPPAALLFATALVGFIAVTRRKSADKSPRE